MWRCFHGSAPRHTFIRAVRRIGEFAEFSPEPPMVGGTTTARPHATFLPPWHQESVNMSRRFEHRLKLETKLAQACAVGTDGSSGPHLSRRGDFLVESSSECLVDRRLERFGQFVQARGQRQPALVFQPE
jgi:hypothetical protein